MTEKIYELTPNDSHKSFYGKAVAVEDGNKAILYSYGTPVAEAVDGIIRKLWDGYSATTMRHINAFCERYGAGEGGKKWWESLPYTPNNLKHRVFKGRTTNTRIYCDFYNTEY